MYHSLKLLVLLTISVIVISCHHIESIESEASNIKTNEFTRFESSTLYGVAQIDNVDTVLHYASNLILETKYIEAIGLIDSAIKYKKDNNLTKDLGELYSMIARAYEYDRDIEKTIYYLRRSIDANLEEGNQEGLANTYQLIGLLYIDSVEEPEIGAQHVEAALKIYEKIEKYEGQLRCLISLANSSIGFERLKKAERYIERGYEVAKKIDNPNAIRICRLSRSYLDIAEGNPEKAIVEISKLTKYYEEKNDILRYNWTKSYLSEAYRTAGDFEKSLRLDEELLLFHDSTKIAKLTMETYEDIHEDYKGLGNYRESLKYLELAKFQRDSLDRLKNSILTKKLNQFESEKNELELAAVTAEFKNDKLKLFIILGLLSLGVLFLWFFLFKQRQLRAKDAELHEIRERNLKSINSTLSKEICEKEKNIIRLEEELINSVSNQQSVYKNDITEEIRKMSISTDQDWDDFKFLFKKIEPTFLKEIEKLDVDFSNNDLRILTMFKLDFSMDNIAHVLGISKESVRKGKYRLKKKLEIKEDKAFNSLISSMG